MQMKVKRGLLFSTLALSAVALFGCGSDSNPVGQGVVPSTYKFDSKFTPGTDSVSNAGQIARQVLIADLNTKIASGLDAEITAATPTITVASTKANVLAKLNIYYEGGTAVLGGLGTTPITTAVKAADTVNSVLQTTYVDVHPSKNLKDKMAGNDAVTDHKVWNTPGTLVGFPNTTPEALLQKWLGEIAQNTVDQVAGVPRLDPTVLTNPPTLKLYQSTDGLDLKQLVQKFLLGAVTFQQGTDDYLDDATPNKGLLSNNIEKHDGTDPFTALEHGFDEGFGYFGAARDYNDYSDNEIKGSGQNDTPIREGFRFGYHDASGDGKIDLLSEFNFGNSTNAAKRDAGSKNNPAKTDFTKTIFDAFLTGRTIINHAAGRALNTTELANLKIQRNIIVINWEKAIAATVVHYINEIRNLDMANFGDQAYSYSNHIKHWGEMKGFSLGFQFNPRSALSDEKFAEFHTLVGEKPVLPGDTQVNIDAYDADLLTARGILQAAYGFDATNVAGW